MSPLTFRLPLGRKSICRYDSGVKGLILTREDWVESSESAPGVNLRCRKPLGGTFDPDEGKAVFDNRLCIEGRKKNTVDEPTKCVWLLPCQNKTIAVQQMKENSAPFLKAGKSLELCMLDLALTVFFFHKMLRSSPSPLCSLLSRERAAKTLLQAQSSRGTTCSSSPPTQPQNLHHGCINTRPISSNLDCCISLVRTGLSGRWSGTWPEFPSDLNPSVTTSFFEKVKLFSLHSTCFSFRVAA